nr:MAG: RNA-dependent RNA polymerase [Riboviria sp.]
MRGEEKFQPREPKWNTGANQRTITNMEKRALKHWLLNATAAVEPIDFGPVDPLSTNIPLDTSAGLPFKLMHMTDKQTVLSQYGMETLIAIGELQLVKDSYVQYEFLKVEPIKATKDVRTVITYPAHVHFALCKWLLGFSAWSKQFKECKIGWSKFYNGIYSLVSELNIGQGATYFEADAKRWDSTIPTELVELVLEVYFSKFPPGVLDDELQAAIIRSITCGWVASSNGEVYYRQNGNSSGNPVTSEINTLAHLCVWLLAYYRTYHELETFRTSMCVRLYGDDVIGSSLSLSPSQFRESIRDLKIVYPEEDWKVQNTPIGLTFLGNVITQINNYYVWTPAKPGKMWASLRWCEKQSEDTYVKLMERLVSLCMEYAWQPDIVAKLGIMLESTRLRIDEKHPYKTWVWNYLERDHISFGIQRPF